MGYGSVTVTHDSQRSIFKLRTEGKIMDDGSIHARKPSPNAATSSFGTTKLKAEKQQLC